MSESFDFEDNFTQSVTETQQIDEGSSDEDRESMKFLIYILNWFENISIDSAVEYIWIKSHKSRYVKTTTTDNIGN